MKKRGNTFMLVALVAAAAVVAVFAGVRLRDIRAVQGRLDDLDRKTDQTLRSGAEIEMLRKRFPPRADVSSFVENLSVLAKRNGLQNLEIATLPAAVGRARAGGQPRPKAAPEALLVAYPVKLTFEGSYRAVAEYLRQVQGMERYKRIVSVEMKPFKQRIKTSLVIEITAFEASHAS